MFNKNSKKETLIVLQIYAETLKNFWLLNPKNRILSSILTGNLVKELAIIIEQNRKVALQGLWIKQQKLAELKTNILREIKELND